GGAGAGGGGRGGGGAGHRGGGAGGGGAAAGVARRTGAGRGAVTVTSGSVSPTCPRPTSGNINAPIATACNRPRRRTQSRDVPRSRPPRTGLAPRNIPNQLSNIA